MRPTRRAVLAAAAAVAATRAGALPAPPTPASSDPGVVRVSLDALRMMGDRRVIPVRRFGGDRVGVSVRVGLDWPGRAGLPRPGLPAMLLPGVDETLVPLDLLHAGPLPGDAVAWVEPEGNYGRMRVEASPWTVDAHALGPWPEVPLRRVVHPRYPPYRRPPAYREAFRSDLVAGFRANDAGIGPDGRPCWRTRLGHGRVQRDNGEVGIATDPVLHADHGVRPFAVEDGRRVLVAERLARPIRYEDRDWHYSGPVLTTETMFVAGYGWIEARLAMEGGRGTWPAFWAKPRGLWPPEEDIVEWACPDDDPSANRPFFTQWWTTPEGKAMAGHQVDVAGLLPGFDRSAMHDYALHWTEDAQVWTVDGTVVHAQPNMNRVRDVAPDIRMYLKLNVAVGGLGGVPDDAALPARMTVEHVAAWASDAGE